MKKTIIALMVLALAGCGNNKQVAENATEDTVIIQETEETALTTDTVAPEAVATAAKPRRYCNDLYGFCITYNPEKFKPSNTESYDGRKFISADKKAELMVYGSLSMGTSLNDLLQLQIKSEGLKEVRQNLSNNQYILRGKKGNKIYFERTMASGDNFITVTGIYDQSVKELYAEEIEKTAKSISTVGPL